MEKKMLELTQEQFNQLEKLQNELYSLMHHYNYNPDGSDYSCCFCGHQASINGETFKHRDDCLGEALHKTFREIL